MPGGGMRMMVIKNSMTYDGHYNFEDVSSLLGEILTEKSSSGNIHFHP